MEEDGLGLLGVVVFVAAVVAVAAVVVVERPKRILPAVAR